LPVRRMRKDPGLEAVQIIATAIEVLLMQAK
jgi:hypothetical protein